MRRFTKYSRYWRWTAVIAAGLMALSPALSYAQRGGGGGGGIGVGGGGGGGGGVRVGGGGVNVGGGGQAGGAVHTGGAPVNAGGTIHAGGQGTVTVPGAGNIHVAPNTSGAVRTQVTTPNAGANVGGNAGAKAAAAVPHTVQRTQIPNVNVPNVGANVTGAANAAGNAGVRSNVPNVGNAANAAGNAAVRTTVPNVGNAANANAGVNGNARVGVNAGANALGNQTGARVNTGVNAGLNTQSAFRHTANWYNLSPQQRATIHANVQNAWRANANANLGSTNWLQSNPNRAAYWAGYGNGIRSGFYYGGSPYFGGSPFYTNNFWGGRNLIGLGLSAITGGGYGGFGGGFGTGFGPGYGGYNGWWGYQPWLNTYPANYWWGTPTWNSMYTWFPNYGWNQPYYYDYGPNGNVVYTNGNVLVNGQSIGTAATYSQTAAELAAIDPSAIGQTDPNDWMPLGTFSFALTQDETNPARVIQLAVHKQGYISGTVYNRNSDKLYSVQGRVDKDTQRVAFTIGDNKDTVLETGLYNLTQEQTPVLVHQGPTQTTTYLFARLQPPQTETQGSATTTQNAAIPQPGVAR